MIRHLCPNCDWKLASSDSLAGLPLRCPHCNHDLEVPLESQSAVEPDPPAPERPVRTMEPGGAEVTTVLAACALFAVCFASFFTPWGWITALWVGVQKGGAYCQCTGCMRLSEAQIPYELKGSIRHVGFRHVGYCKEHEKQKPNSFSGSEEKSLKRVLGFFLILGPILYLIWYVIALVGVFRAEQGAFKTVVILSVSGLILNLICYGFWIWLYPVMSF